MNIIETLGNLGTQSQINKETWNVKTLQALWVQFWRLRFYSYSSDTIANVLSAIGVYVYNSDVSYKRTYIRNYFTYF